MLAGYPGAVPHTLRDRIPVWRDHLDDTTVGTGLRRLNIKATVAIDMRLTHIGT
jgi:hypothetical protein